MGFFDDDPFEDIVREFFGHSPGYKERRTRRAFSTSEEEDRTIDFVETEDYVYIIFELPGYGEDDISVVVKGNTLELSAKKKNNDGTQDYLQQKLNHGLFIKKTIPNFVNPKKFDYTIRNGILEIKLERK